MSEPRRGKAAEPRPAASLNAAQMEAVQHLGGPCLVLAGAGSGKTRVITHKIARLLQADYQPKQIAAITFTNKAAQEMRERAKALVGPRAAKDLAISTFHSLGVRILRTHGERVGLKPQFSILDSDDVLGILRDAGGCTDNALARRWQWTISRWKNDGLNSDQADAVAADDDERVAARVMKRYEERLAAYQAVDFDDLIGLPHRLLQRDAEVREKLQDQLRYVLVDEYQDTNAIQYELLKLLAGERGLFTAVGDDDQSIYGWRGATIDNLRRLPADYPRLKVIRARAELPLDRADPARRELRDRQQPEALREEAVERPRRRRPDRAARMRRRGARSRARRRAHQGAARAGRRARHERPRGRCGRVEGLRGAVPREPPGPRVREGAAQGDDPVQVSGGQSFFDRAEIKDLCAWLRLLVNNDDDPAFLRAVTTPKRGIGHQTLASLGEFATRWKSSLFEALFAESLGTALSARAVGSLHEFGRAVNDLQYRARQTTGAEDAKALLLGWLKDIDYEQHLRDGEDSEKLAASRWANVLDFVDWIAKRCGGEIENDGGATFETEKKSVLDVAQTISVIISLAERGDEQNVVTLSTLHAAKGLEWPHVVLVGVNEGLLPFKSEDDADDGVRGSRRSAA